MTTTTGHVQISKKDIFNFHVYIKSKNESKNREQELSNIAKTQLSVSGESPILLFLPSLPHWNPYATEQFLSEVITVTATVGF